MYNACNRVYIDFIMKGKYPGPGTHRYFRPDDKEHMNSQNDDK